MEEINFYTLDGTYKIVNGKPEIILFAKTEDNRQIIIKDKSFEPYFYVFHRDENIIEKLEKLRVENENEVYFIARIEKIKKNFIGKEVSCLKVFANIPSAVANLREIIKKWDAVDSVNEADIPFIRRYFIDKNICPLSWYRAKGTFMKDSQRVPVFEMQEAGPIDKIEISNLKVLAFDIETYSPFDMQIDMESNPIIMLAFHADDFQKVFTWKKFETALPYVELVKNEEELIAKFKQAVLEYKPDVLTGYFSDGFDLPYIKTRAEKYKIKMDVGWDFTDLRSKKGRDDAIQINGIIHLDIFKFIKKTIGPTMDTDSFDLSSVAGEILGEEKHDVSLKELTHVWDYEPEKLEPFAKYNLHDTYLTHALAMKMMETIKQMVRICCMPMYDINRMGFSQLVEGYIMNQASLFNEIAPNKPSDNELVKRRMFSYEGAFVLDPKPGLYKDLVVFDFRSLYPSILTSHNVGPDTLNCDDCARENTPDGENWFCTKKKGFIPTLVENIIKTRMSIKEAVKQDMMNKRPVNSALDAQSNTLKLLANSFYGYMGFYAARWYSVESAKSITAWGRVYIQKVIEQAQKEGFNVLYSDTDSIFIALGNKTKDDAKNFAKMINKDLPGVMELEYENFYPSGIFVSAKMGAFGAKKKYALISEQGNLKIRGFETVRRNWSVIAQDVQENVLDIVLREHDTLKALDYVKKIVKDTRTKKVPNEMTVIRTQLQKDLLDYANKGPHVAVAQRMINMGKKIGPGTIIKYIVTQGGDIIRNRAKLPEEVKPGEYDPSYYIDNQIIPSVERIFNVLGYKKEDLLETKEQTKLAGFF